MPIATSKPELQVIVASLDEYLKDPTSEQALEECKKVATTGALIIRDSRAQESVNQTFLTLLEDYYSQPLPLLALDERPELGYQVGITLPSTEKPSCMSTPKCQAIIAGLEETQRPLDLLGHEADPKSRFFWSMGGKGKEGEKLEIVKDADGFEKLNAPNVVPKAFEGVWEEKMNDWGSRMKQAVEGVAEMLAVGLGLDKDVFLAASRHGPHLLAPTATDLSLYGQLNSIFAGFHSDLNFLTIHGKSRYPGLHIWPRNTGSKLPFSIPDGCLLLQAGKQCEWMTGGLVKAGYHEVVCTQGTVDAMERMKVEHPDRPLIRISSTFFYHLSSQHLLQPIPELAQKAEERFGKQEEYGKMLVGNQVKRELGLIALMTPEDE